MGIALLKPLCDAVGEQVMQHLQSLGATSAILDACTVLIPKIPTIIVKGGNMRVFVTSFVDLTNITDLASLQDKLASIGNQTANTLEASAETLTEPAEGQAGASQGAEPAQQDMVEELN